MPATATPPEQVKSTGPEFYPTPNLDEAFDGLDALDTAPDPQPPKPSEGEPKPPEPPPAKPSEKAAEPPVKPEEKPAVKPPEPPAKPAEVKPSETPLEKMAPKQLRDEYTTLKTKYKELEQAHEKLRTAKPPEDPEKKTLAEALEKQKQDYDRLKGEFELTAYERSAEYRERYYQPFVNAWVAAREEAAQLEVTTPDGTTRPATAQDFDTIMEIKNPGQAARTARELFGEDGALTVMSHRNRIVSLNREMVGALEKGRQTYAEKLKQLESAQTAVRTEMEGIVKDLQTAQAEKYPKLFKTSPEDAEGSGLLEKGYELFDRAFKGNPADPALTKQQRVDLLALRVAMRNRAASFGRIMRLLKSAEARAKSAEDELTAIKSSAPPRGEAKGEGGKKELSYEEEIEALDDGRPMPD